VELDPGVALGRLPLPERRSISWGENDFRMDTTFL